MKRLLLLLTLSLFLNLHINAQVPQAERDALIDLYNATNGPNWTNNTNWNTETPVSSWHGITVENNVVTEVALSNRNLEGSIPNSILNLTSVIALEFASNLLDGTIPDFSVLPNIQRIYIHLNHYDFLDFQPNFSNNSTISNFFYSPQKPRDEVLNIDAIIGNDYNFTMTPVEGTNVQYQWYKGSVFSGGVLIPDANTTILDLPNIQTEDLDTYVCFATSATIPDLIIKRATIDLKGPVSQEERDALIAIYNTTGGPNWLNLENWNTVAPVSTWGGVTTTGNKVTRLSLQSYSPNGQLPEDIGNLTNLEELYIGLYDFNLTGPIPESIGNLTKLRVLWFQATGMSGEIPESIGNLVNLREMKFLGNNFYGVIPESIGNLIHLTSLVLDGTEFVGNGSDFSGILPASLGDLSNLQILRLSHNSFDGELPVSLSTLTNIEEIHINDNNIFGELPFNSPNAHIAIANNHFDFSDIEPFVQAGNYNTLDYTPQRTQDVEEVIESGVGADITLNVNDTNLGRSENDTAENNNYQWYKDGVAINGATSADYTIFNVQVDDSGDYHCQITNSILPNLIIVRAAITLNIDSELGVEDVEYNYVSVYPNPTKNWLNISTATLTNAKLSIYDLNGRLIIAQAIQGNLNALNVENLQIGTYILKIEHNSFVVSKRFIKQ